jgi:Spy/CpxP family protein refolding chaperone
LTKEKLDALEADLKVLSSVQLPAEAVLELKLTADQKKSLAEIAKQSQEKVREMIQSGDREGVTALREAVVGKVSGVLTAEQKAVVAKYPMPRMGGAGVRGGTRPGGPPPVK